MPISRRKSCIPCRAAKARCNLERTCSRCIERGLTCDYGDAQPRPASAARRRFGAPPRSSAERNTTTLPGEYPHVDFREGVMPAAGFIGPGYGSPQLLDPLVGGQSLATDLAQDLDMATEIDLGAWPLGDWSTEGTTVSNNDSRPWQMHALPPSPTRPRGGDHQEAHPVSPDSPPEIDLPTVGRDSSSTAHYISKSLSGDYLKQCIVGFSHVFSNPGSGDLAVRPDRLDGTLTLKRPPSHQSFLMSQVLLGQITKYPQMLLQARLPPFIYPHCVLEGRLVSSCARDGLHVCMPEPLAVCATVVRMASKRTTQSSHFIWKTIMEQQKKLGEEYETYDIETLLAATQAAVIYTLLIAEDSTSVPCSTIGKMLVTLGDLVGLLHIYQNQKFLTDFYTEDSLTQREWVLYESTRRVACLLQVLETLLDLMIGGHDLRTAECAGFAKVPLPCLRDLWDYEHREAWGYRLRQYMERRGEDRNLTIRHLLQARKPAREADAAERDGRLMAEMARWCAGIDELGTLVWMAAWLE